MNCHDCRSHILSDGLTADVRGHVDGCLVCSDELEQLLSIRETLAEDAVWAEPSLDLADQIVASIAPTPRPARRSWIGWVAAIAVVAVALGSLAIVRSRPEAADWESTLVGEGIALGSTVDIAAYEHSRGTELILTPHNLPVAPEGTYYELWFANDASIVSAGTFATGFPVTLYIAALRDDYPRMGVTIELVDDDPSSSGDVVLRQR